MSVFVPEGTPAFPFRVNPRATEANPLRFGRIEGEPIEEYHKAPVLSKTKADIFFQSPRLFQGRFITGEFPPEPPTDALIIGGALDALALEGEPEFNRRYCVLPEGCPRRPTAAQLAKEKKTPAAIRSITFWDAWDAENKGKVGLDAEQFELVQTMATKLGENKEFAAFRSIAKSQITYRLRGDKFAVQCRPDLIDEKGSPLTNGRPAILDLKTVRELPADDPDALRRHIADFGYHRSAFWYRDVVSLANRWGDFRPPFYLGLIEKKEPYAVLVREVDAISIEIAEIEIREALQRLEKCIAENVWPESWEEPWAPTGLPEYYIRNALKKTDVRTI